MAVATVALLVLVLPAAAVQPPHEAPATGAAHGDQHDAASGEAHGEAHGESLGAFLSRIGNFLLLAGGLYYLLRSPVKRYLDSRGQQIRSDLHSAAELRTQAMARMADIDARLKALPGELEALKARGKEEVAAEQVRIKQAAEAERQRLVEQTRREIDRQLQIARRDLTEFTADLAVGVARTRLSQGLSPADQQRLVDRYVAGVGGRHE
jgi:F0F1-type ATP synthase membrane subunit b/b'